MTTGRCLCPCHSAWRADRLAGVTLSTDSAVPPPRYTDPIAAETACSFCKPRHAVAFSDRPFEGEDGG